MEVTTSSLSGAPLLEVSGEIDHATCDLLSHSMSAALAGDDPIVLVDASQITYLDSSGISLLFATVRRLRHKGWVGIIGANANVRRLMEIVGLTVDNGLRLFPDRPTAAQAVKDTSSE